MDRSFVENNHRQLKRLQAFAAQVTDEELVAPMPAGWNPASVLAHLAFWDHRALLLIERWQKEGFNESPLDTDLVNEVTRYFFVNLPPREALRLALESAEAIDQVLAALDQEFIESMRTNGRAVQVDRGRHRGNHLDEIERVIGKSYSASA